MTKSELRKIIKEKRSLIDNKTEKDDLIFKSVISLDEYKKADTILSYLSLQDEITTDRLIEYSLSVGKKVAIPYCKDDKGNMEFYLITSLEDTETGSFNVREPIVEKCAKVNDFTSSIIIVPGLAFDLNGYRLGYGKGYYDRFLKNYTFISVGLCYNSLIEKELPISNYDISVDIIVSENNIIRINDGGKNG